MKKTRSGLDFKWTGLHKSKTWIYYSIPKTIKSLALASEILNMIIHYTHAQILLTVMGRFNHVVVQGCLEFLIAVYLFTQGEAGN